MNENDAKYVIITEKDQRLVKTSYRGFVVGFRVFNHLDEVIEIDTRPRTIDFYYVPDEFKTKADYAQWLLDKYPNLTLYVYDVPDTKFSFDDEEILDCCDKRVIRMCLIPTVSLDSHWRNDRPDVKFHDFYDHGKHVDT
jgi:hypothetical protein